MGAQIVKSGTLTFLVTDLVGSTEQLERLGDEEATLITVTTMSRLGEVATHHGGEIFKHVGDGIMVAFPSAFDAITCAVAMQVALRPRQGDLDPRGILPVRIGIHAGEPMRVGEDYLGMPLNVVVRMSHLAKGGQVIVSGVVRALVGGRGGFVFQDLGMQTLSGLRMPVHAWEVIWTPGDAEANEPLVVDTPAKARAVLADRAPDTVVILFADIVDSMPHTERLGDAGFRERARELDALLRTQVRENRGSTIEGKLVGDGVLAIFPSARSAITCALQCGALSESVGLELHLGIHAGDVIREGSNIYGGAVNIASRISGATKAGEILVSDTLRGLARTSAGVVFEDRGDYTLKGIDEPMRLFTVRA